MWTVGADTNCMNVFHYRYTGGQPSGADLNSIAAHLANASMGSYLTNVPSDVALTSIIATDLQGNNGLQGSAPSTHVGTGGTPPQPASVCLVMHLGVNARYRGGHPRAYFPGLTAANMANAQSWTPGVAAGNVAALATWLQALQGFSTPSAVVGNQCVVSYYSKALNPTPPHRRTTPLVLDVQSWSAMTRIGSQRRRLVVGQ